MRHCCAGDSPQRPSRAPASFGDHCLALLIPPDRRSKASTPRRAATPLRVLHFPRCCAAGPGTPASVKPQDNPARTLPGLIVSLNSATLLRVDESAAGAVDAVVAIRVKTRRARNSCEPQGRLDHAQ
ncbi:hypothetical protein CIC12_27415 [Burkholderia sp. SG-MS1]|nr:hypothetical protein [Paraburkholderia sp. SG-MS1]